MPGLGSGWGGAVRIVYLCLPKPSIPSPPPVGAAESLKGLGHTEVGGVGLEWRGQPGREMGISLVSGGEMFLVTGAKAQRELPREARAC